MFKPPNLQAYRRTDNIKCEILKNQIGHLRKELQSCCRKYTSSKSRLKEKLSSVQFTALMNRLEQRCQQENHETQQRHQKKLTNLWRSQRVPAPDCLINKSSRKLTIEEENSLRLGLKNHILPPKVDEIHVKTQVEKLWNFNKRTISSGIDVQTESEVKEDIRHSTISFLKSAKNICNSRVNQNFHRTLKTLKSDSSIKVCSFDKGSGIVIVNTEDYYEKLDHIVLDKSKFQEIPVSGKTHPVIRNEKKIADFLKTKVKDKIGVKEFDSICPSGSQPGKLYGLCKVHKLGFPFRPVVSMIGTAEYNLAKYLDRLIKPHIPSKYMLESTGSFLTRLRDFMFKPSDILVSFDVVSLFTNVPLKYTIDIITNKIYESNSRPAVAKEDFKKMLEFATSGMFLYKDKLYKQVDGVTMGSPLGPTLANFCLAHFESQLLSDNSDENSSPALYARYVDDIFCVFRSGSSYQEFLNKLNNMHANLQFTAEIGPSVLPFLDTCVSLPSTEEDTYTTRVFRKSTYTGLMLNFASLCPNKWKFGLVQCLLHRAYLISSDWHIFSKEIDFLKSVFSKNGYPADFFCACVNKFLNGKCATKSNTKITEDKVETIFFVPYVGLPSVIFGRKVRDLLMRNYGINVKIVYTTFKVKNYFSLKCRTPLPLLANVVYRFTCLRYADISYIGKTKRHLVTRVRARVEEHSKSASAVCEHLEVCNLCRSEYSVEKNFRILDKGKNDFEITIKELLHIKTIGPLLTKS